uniref:CBY1 interacting BAR domain containing 2 n=1 Tax=Sus scrofa TaxID=9823 RepID=A0A8D1LWY8_PIG
PHQAPPLLQLVDFAAEPKTTSRLQAPPPRLPDPGALRPGERPGGEQTYESGDEENDLGLKPSHESWGHSQRRAPSQALCSSQAQDSIPSHEPSVYRAGNDHRRRRLRGGGEDRRPGEKTHKGQRCASRNKSHLEVKATYGQSDPCSRLCTAQPSPHGRLEKSLSRILGKGHEVDPLAPQKSKMGCCFSQPAVGRPQLLNSDTQAPPPGAPDAEVRTIQSWNSSKKRIRNMSLKGTSVTTEHRKAQAGREARARGPRGPRSATERDKPQGKPPQTGCVCGPKKQKKKERKFLYGPNKQNPNLQVKRYQNDTIKQSIHQKKRKAHPASREK